MPSNFRLLRVDSKVYTGMFVNYLLVLNAFSPFPSFHWLWSLKIALETVAYQSSVYMIAVFLEEENKKWKWRRVEKPDEGAQCLSLLVYSRISLNPIAPPPKTSAMQETYQHSKALSFFCCRLATDALMKRCTTQPNCCITTCQILQN